MRVFGTKKQPSPLTVFSFEHSIFVDLPIELRTRHRWLYELGFAAHCFAPPTPAFRFKKRRTLGGKWKSPIFWSKLRRAPPESRNSQLSTGCPAFPVCSSARGITVRSGAFLFARTTVG